MIAINRRRFLALLTTSPLLVAFRVRPADMTIEAEDASVFFAPYCLDRLVSRTPLAVVERAGASYLALDDRLIARLPARFARIKTPPRVSVARTACDADGRLRLFVSLSTG